MASRPGRQRSVVRNCVEHGVDASVFSFFDFKPLVDEVRATHELRECQLEQVALFVDVHGVLDFGVQADESSMNLFLGVEASERAKASCRGSPGASSKQTYRNPPDLPTKGRAK